MKQGNQGLTTNTSPIETSFHAHGKLLLSAEYVVLDGALALALPTQQGQRLTTKASNSPKAQWIAKEHTGMTWLDFQFSWPNLALIESSDEQAGHRLISLLQIIKELRPGFLESSPPLIFETQLEFPQQWGLGTSSTLVTLLSKWAQVNPFDLLRKTFGGSGYDLACALSEYPILYRLDQGRPHWVEIPYTPTFKEKLFFVYLGKKQNSRAGIQRYRKLQINQAQSPNFLKPFNELTWQLLTAPSLIDFESILLEHEEQISRLLDLPRAKDLYFTDYTGEIKSLGAWGGDFVLATGLETEAETKGYFEQKGFKTILTFNELFSW